MSDRGGLSELKTDADLDAAINQLADPRTRLTALEQLIELGKFRIFQVGSVIFLSNDRKHQALVERAADAVAGCRNDETFRAALRSPRAQLQFWALWRFPPTWSTADVRWVAMLPRVRQLAAGPDAAVRGRAQERLAQWPGQAEFLSRCLEAETNTGNVMQMCYQGNGADFARRFNEQLLGLLHHADEGVRREVLGQISSTPHLAPMYQITYDAAVIARVLELSWSPSNEERAMAAWALGWLVGGNPTVVSPRLAELAADKTTEVRTAVAGGLRGQRDRSGVKEILIRLVGDPVPRVRCFAIIELGPREYLRELEQLAAGTGEEIARVAKWQLVKAKEKP